MPQPPRTQAPGAIYHLTTRGVDRRAVFSDDDDRHLLLRLLARVVRLDGWLVHAYCLMTNHLHLLVETPRANVAHGMQRLLSQYAREHNAAVSRRGHLFESRYADRLVESEAHLLSAARYVVRNPVEAGLCRHPADWLWSSYRATAGLARTPAFLTTRTLLEPFGSPPAVARAAYRAFVCDEPAGRRGKIAA